MQVQTKHLSCQLYLMAALLYPLQVPAEAQASAVDLSSPPAMKHPLIASHGIDRLGVFHLAAGEYPHPTANLFHCLPRFEQNLELAHALCRDRWNVLAIHYRGSWGSGGTFSFLHSVEDADEEMQFLMNPTNSAKYHIDRTRLVVFGCSMGGFIAASAAVRNPGVRPAVLLSAWNIGAPRPSEAHQAKALASGENLAPIAGAGGPA